MAQVIEQYAPKFIARMHTKYLHDSHIFNGNWALNLEKSNPIFAKLHSHFTKISVCLTHFYLPAKSMMFF
jgi:hypothetical protein